MKKIILILLFIPIFSFSQKMITRTGEIKFEASMPALEEVSAKTNSASCVLNKSNGKIETLVLVKSFKFKIPLMEEHFNENYIESSKYSKATFKGEIINYDATKKVNTTYELEGNLTIHGITKKIKTLVVLEDNNEKLNIKTTFLVKAEDYKINIPSLVKNKIAENISIDCDFKLTAK